MMGVHDLFFRFLFGDVTQLNSHLVSKDTIDLFQSEALGLFSASESAKLE